MSSSKTGVIPLAVSQIFNTAERLKELNWEYKFQGEFLEIYNERIIDLLKPQDDIENNTVKYEIRHDTAARSTTVTGLTSTPLSTPRRPTRCLSVQLEIALWPPHLQTSAHRVHTVFLFYVWWGATARLARTRTGVLNLIDIGRI